MIKLCCFVKRKPGMDRDAFHSHWLESHGPLIRDTPELADPLLRYEQNHRLDADYERDPDGFDGVTMQWFASFEDFTAFVASDAYRDVLSHDEASFLDRANLALIFAGPANRVIVDPAARAAAGTKLLCLLTRQPKLSAEAFHAHWRSPHGELFRDTETLARHIAAYEQHPRSAHDYGRAGGGDGLAEQWYRDLDAFAAFVREPAQAELIRPDEDRFIDRAAIRYVLTGPADVIIDDHDHDRDALEAGAVESESQA